MLLKNKLKENEDNDNSILLYYIVLDIKTQIFSLLELLKNRQKGIDGINKEIFVSLQNLKDIKKIENKIFENEILKNKFKNMKISFGYNGTIKGRSLNGIFMPDITGMIGIHGRDSHSLNLKTILTRPGVDSHTGKTIPTILMFDSANDNYLRSKKIHGMTIQEQIKYLKEKFKGNVKLENFYTNSLDSMDGISEGSSMLANLARKLL